MLIVPLLERHFVFGLGVEVHGVGGVGVVAQGQEAELDSGSDESIGFVAAYLVLLLDPLAQRRPAHFLTRADDRQHVLDDLRVFGLVLLVGLVRTLRHVADGLRHPVQNGSTNGPRPCRAPSPD